jgi:hypothetical protein
MWAVFDEENSAEKPSVPPFSGAISSLAKGFGNTVRILKLDELYCHALIVMPNHAAPHAPEDDHVVIRAGSISKRRGARPLRTQSQYAYSCLLVGCCIIHPPRNGVLHTLILPPGEGKHPSLAQGLSLRY